MVWSWAESFDQSGFVVPEKIEERMNRATATLAVLMLTGCSTWVPVGSKAKLLDENVRLKMRSGASVSMYVLKREGSILMADGPGDSVVDERWQCFEGDGPYSVLEVGISKDRKPQRRLIFGLDNIGT